ncbi:hypothetical protein VCR29J2_50054 [Vibrio coralliirubri]|nr:hypothetical protein VCR29J2_50054 [Vibrio coralliirubri]
MHMKLDRMILYLDTELFGLIAVRALNLYPIHNTVCYNGGIGKHLCVECLNNKWD